MEDPKNEDEIFSCSYNGLEQLKAIFTRAAIAYLRHLSSQSLSNDLLVNEGILDAHAATQVSEVVTITNYRLRIQTAINLLTSWCREQTGDGQPDLEQLGLIRPRTTDNLLDLLVRKQSRPLPVPVADSVLGPNPPAIVLKNLEGMNLPYHIERIPKTMPPVLSELKLRGLHHYVAHTDYFSYEQAQDIVAFLDKMKPYVSFESTWNTPYGPIDAMRTVFIGCEPGGRVLIG